MSGPSRRRFVVLSLAVIPLGLVMAAVAGLLVRLIDLITNVSFFGRFSFGDVSPAHNTLGWWVVFIPALGGVLVGVMARFGSKAIRGHGIPEAMEQILENGSRIPPRLTWLKPISAAISIGTGGPFGAEGPIIATGGAGGSLLGQLFSTTAVERKTLLAAGAAAGMAAIFNSPVSAVLLAVELLLFEFKPRSFVPVALASAVAAAARGFWFPGGRPVFAMPEVAPVGLAELSFDILLGAACGAFAVAVSKAVYAIEDGFEHLPLPWMTWPALGGLVVGAIGYFEPRTLGVGYDNITAILSGSFTVAAVAALCAWKFASWSVALGSGTSGGTLAPLLTIGSGAGLVVGSAAGALFPSLHLQPHLAALVGMASLFAGASQALLASVVFACETTGRIHALLPLLGAGAAALAVARFISRSSIMSEKIVRRGIAVPSQYEADVYTQTTVAQVMETGVPTFAAETPAREILDRLAAYDPEICRHQALLLADAEGKLAGIVTRGDLLEAAAAAVSLDGPVLQFGCANLVVAHPDEFLQTALERLLQHGIGRMPVVSRQEPGRLVGYLTRAAILSARSRRLREESFRDPGWFSTTRDAKV